MRVAIDITAAATQQAGIGRSVRELVNALVVQPDRPDLTLVYTRRGPSPAADALSVHERVRVRRIPVSPRIALAAWFKARAPLPGEAMAGRANVFHGPDFTLPPLVASHGVVTVHDLSYVIRPQDAHPRQRRFLEKAVPKSIDRARLVIAVSEATRRDLMQRYGVRPHRIRVVPNAVPDWFGPIADDEELAAVRRRLGLPERFVLSVGTIQPRKNIAGLARAVALASARTGSPAVEHVHAGGEGWLCDQVYAAIEQAGDRVRFVGRVDDQTLRALYSLASAYAYPSHGEGFGITILEAFACGCPVLTSDTPATIEVAAGGALALDPEDPEALADGLITLLTDETARDDLVERGQQRRWDFSWRQSARRLLEVYREAAAGPPAPPVPAQTRAAG
ncbi:MAG: glycosyltransferase family 1 protein [Chloroflexi bacterium]|nr:glycosyltransferase family 1 protein [Chloroflexota bacterium]